MISIMTYKRMAKTHHPDVGGNDEAFKKVTAAYQQARAS